MLHVYKKSQFNIELGFFICGLSTWSCEILLKTPLSC